MMSLVQTKKKSPKGKGPATPKSTGKGGPSTPKGTPNQSKTLKSNLRGAKTPKSSPRVAKTLKNMLSIAETSKGTPSVATTPKGVLTVAKTKGTPTLVKAPNRISTAAKTTEGTSVVTNNSNGASTVASICQSKPAYGPSISKTLKRKFSSHGNGRLVPENMPSVGTPSPTVNIMNTSMEESVISKIMPLLAPHGEVVKIRFAKQNKLQAVFKTAEEAHAAIKNLNGVLFDGRILIVAPSGFHSSSCQHSVDLSHLPSGLTIKDVVSTFSSCGKIVWFGNGSDRGGFVLSFETAEGAKAAASSNFKKFREVKISPSPLSLRWHPPENTVMVFNPSPDVSEDDMWQLMSSAGPVSKVWFKPYKNGGGRNAFVCMKNHADVGKALQLNNTPFKNSVVKVMRCRKVAKEKVPSKKQKMMSSGMV